MNDDQKLANAILAMAQLSPGERATVISVVKRMRIAASEPSKSLLVAGKPQNHGKPIDDYERHEFMRFAAACQRMPPRKRSRVYNEAARKMGRSYDSVRGEILKALRDLKKSTTTQKERS